VDGTSLPENTQGLSDLVVPIAGLAQMKNPACAAVKREAEEEGAKRNGDNLHFAYRIDAWDAEGENVTEHLAGVEDLQVTKATYLAARQRWPGTPIALRQGTRVIEDSRQTRLV
jgi:hypothetical protein